MGFWVSGVAGLANFSPRVLDFTINCTGFWILRCVRGFWFSQFSCSGFRNFIKRYRCFRVFEIMESMLLSEIENIALAMHRVSEKENVGNNRRLLTKIEDLCSEMWFRVCVFASGFSAFFQF